MSTGILGVGGFVPDRVIGNDTIAAWAGVPQEWVLERTGIHERRYAGPGTATSDLAVRAVRQIFAARPGTAELVDALVLATCTPDVPQPATAAIVQSKLGLRTVPAFDVNAVCSGFLYGMAVAHGLRTALPDIDHVLVVGADIFSSIMNRADRRTVSLFGDGAGAVLMGPVPDGYGLLAIRMITDGELHHLVGVPAGGTALPLDRHAREAGGHLLRMDGRAIAAYVRTTLPKLMEHVLADAGLRLEDVDRFVFHQANPRLLRSIADDTGIDPGRMTLTAPAVGNTAGGSIPVTLSATARERPLRTGEHLLFASVGGGMNAAAALVRWH
ncbi:ketoacyl-ACP synthase III [Sphaerisporangium sp. B11E5]|uniref:3-oxoacyl-ACP synthase III family protein n=1 Tax=Sphaerisporangium sp. B11E5 TaxID=3153563 RepID=UPI00325C629E